MDEFKIQPLIGPGTPFRGINSATPACYLPPGKLADSENLRIVQGVPVVRLPLRTTGGSVTGGFRGACECLFDGSPTLFLAVLVSGSVRIYKSTDNGASFVEITAASGPYGNTRLADNGLVEFQVVKDRPPFTSITAYDCLVIQNNSDAPRIYAQTDELGGGFSSIPAYGVSKVILPDTPANAGYSSTLSNRVTISNPASITSYTSATGLTLTNGSATNGKNYINVALASTYVGGTYSRVVLAATLPCPSQAITYVVSSPKPVLQDWKPHR